MRARTFLALVLGLSVLLGVGADAQNLEPINALPVAPNVNSTDLVPIFQNGTTKSATVGQVVGGTAPIQVPIGGTGLGFLTPNTVLVGEGNNPINQVGPGVAGQVLTSNGPGIDPSWSPAVGGGTVLSVGLTMPGVFAVAGSPVTATGTLAVTASGTSGGIPYFNTSTTMASSGALTALAPILGGGPGGSPVVGGRSGSTTTFGTTIGTLTNGHCVSIDGSGNLIDAGGACTLGGGGGTVNSATAGQMAYYATSTNAVSGNANATISNGALTLGVANTTLGDLILEGSTSGAVTIQPQAAAGTYNFNLPTSAGTSGQPLLSGGGGSSAQTYGTLSVGGGGTGDTTLTAHGVLLGEGTSPIGATAALGAGTFLQGVASADPVASAYALPASVAAHQALVATGTGTVAAKTVPDCQDSAGNHINYTQSSDAFSCGTTSGPPSGTAGGDLGGTYPNPTVISVADITTGTLTVAHGGTGATTLTAHGVVLGEGTSAATATAAMTNGQLLVGQTSADPLPKTVSGDATMAASGALTVASVNGDANVAFLDVNQSFTKGQATTPTAMGTQSPGGTMTLDFSTSNNFTATFGAGNLTIANPSNIKAGECGFLALTQDSVGSRSVTWGSDWKWSGGTAPTLTIVGSASDLLTWCAVSTSVIAAQLSIKGYQ